MADELTTMLTDGAQALEDENRLAGNVQDPSVVDPAGTLANPEGSTPTGGATDNTITEQAPETVPPATNVTQEIPPPTTPEGGGSGGIAGTTTTTETPPQPTVEQTPVAQSDPTLGTATPLAPGEEAPNGPPTVAVLPGDPGAPVDDDSDPGNNDDNFNAGIRNGQTLQVDLPPGLVSEVGLEAGLSAFASTAGTIVIGDPDGITDISTVLIAGQLFTLAQLLSIDPLNPPTIPLEAGDGDTESEGFLTIESFDPTTGTISFTFTLTGPVNNNNPEGNTNIDQNSAFVPFSVTVTDSRGESATASGGIRIVDATPFVLASTEALPQLIVDESAGEIGTPDGTENAAGFDTVSLDVSQFFDVSIEPGTQFGYGADGPGSVSYAIVLNGTSIPSGLFALGINGDAGAEILLSQASPTSVIGSVGGVDYFEITISSTGELALTQLLAIWHPDRTDNDESVRLDLVAGVLKVQQTVTDFDGDQASGTLDIGQGIFVFEDDGPVATNAYAEAGLTLDEDDLVDGSDASKEPTTASGSIFDGTGVSGFTYGADGGALTGVKIGSTVYSIADTATSVTVYFAQNGTSLGTTSTNAAASLQVNADGTYTFNLLDNLLLSDGGDPTQQIESLNDVVGTIALLGKDNDGDLINSGNGISLSLNVVDDVPTATNAYAEAGLTLDEDDLVDGSDASKEPTTASGSIFDGTGVSGFTYGADGGALTGVKIGSTVYSIADTATSVTVYFAQNGTSLGTTSTNAAASLQVNADGTYTFNLLDNLLLSDGGDPTQQIESLNDVVGTIALLGKDNDGDLINSGNGISLSLNVVDDVPTATNAYAEAGLTLDEDDLVDGSDASKEPTTASGSIFDGTGVSGFTYGADGGALTGVKIGSTVYSIADTATSVTVYFAQNGTSLGTTSTNAAASLQVNADGTYTFNLLDNLLLSDGGDPTQQIESLNDVVGTIALLGKDNDGDLINSGNGISLSLNVVDDVPTATNAYAEAGLTLDEDDLVDGSDASKEPTTASGSIFDGTGVSGFTYGADGGALTGVKIGSTVYSIADTATSVTVYFAQNGTSLGTTSTNAAASLQVNADGTYTFNLLDNLLLSDGGDPTQQIESLNDVVGTIALLGKDNDGDLINSGNGISLSLNVVDDVPTATNAYAEAGLTLDEDDLVDGSDASKEPTTASGSIFDGTGVSGFTYGADGGALTGVKIGSTVYSIADTATSVTVYFAQNGTSLGTTSTNAAASLQVNADGTYTFNLLDNLLLSDGGDPTQQIESLNDVVGTIALLGKDNDGDLINSGNGISLSLNVVDDVPTATNAYAEAGLTLDEDDLVDGSDASKEPTTASGSIFDGTGVSGFTYGADGGALTGVKIGSTVYSIADTATSVTVYFAQNGTSLGTTSTNAAASLQVNADGTYTFNLLDNLLLSDGGDPTQQIESLNDVVGTIALLGKDNDGDLINSGNGISLSLNVVDDVPTATNAYAEAGLTLDEDDLVDGSDASKEPTTASGSIFDGTGVSGFTYGADGGALTGVKIGSTVYSIADTATSVTVYFAQNGTSLGTTSTNAAASLQVNADGTYTFNLLDNLLLSDGGDPTQQIESLNDVVGTIALLGKDNDGDLINSGNGISLSLNVVDDVPTATNAYAEAGLTLDEDDLVDGSDASKEPTTASGSIFDGTGVSGFTYGADGGALTGVKIGSTVYSIADTATSVTVYFAQNGTSLGTTSTNAAASLQVNADGTYTFNLLDNLLLSDGGDPTQQIESLNDVVGTIALLGKDNDGDLINSGNGISLSLNVVDDVPTATNAYAEAGLTLDEDDLVDGSDASKEPTTASGSIFDGTGVSGFTYGADGGALTGVKIGSTVYSIADTATSVTVYFAQNGTSLGTTSTNAAASLQVNADGTYTFNLLDNLLLSDGGDPTQQIESLNDVVGTIALLGKDNDGDLINSGNGISLSLNVVDDVPTATNAYAEAGLTLDEDDLVDGSDASKEPTTASGSIFDGTGVSGFTYGADGGALTGVKIGSTVYSIADTATSVTVYFAQNGTSLGTTSTNAAASLQVNADGTYTFNLLDNLLLSDGGDPTQQIESLNDVVGTIALLGKDNDGDLINSGNGISLSLNVVDDVPTATNAYAEAGLTLDEDDLVDGSDASKEPTTASGSIFDGTGVSGFTYGADGGALTGVKIGSTVYSIADTATSVTVYFAQNGTSLGTTSTNAAASLQVNADGTYTFNLLDNLLLSDGGDPTQQIESLNDVVGTIALLGKDNDGDLINSGNGISLSLNVVDDVPTATNAYAEAGLTLDEDDLVDGSDASKEPTTASGSIFDGTGVSGFTYGADGGALTGVKIGSTVYSIADTATSVTVYFAQNGTSLGTTSTNAAASLQVNADGTYTFNLLDNLLLSDGGDPTQQIESLNDVVGTIALLGKDNDGDLINSGNGISLSLNVVDDVPTATNAYAEAGLTLDEDDLVDGSDASKEPTTASGSIFDGTGVSGFTYGADGGALTGVKIGSTVYSIADTATSVTVYFAQNGTSLGTTSTNAAASLQVNADGTYTFNLLDNLLLSDGGDPTQQIESLNDVVGTIALLGKDNDGDLINSGNGISLSLNVVDDVPSFVSASGTSVLNQVGAFNTGSVVFDQSADVIDYLSGLSLSWLNDDNYAGYQLVEAKDVSGNVVEGSWVGSKAGSPDLFTIKFDSDGDYIFTLLQTKLGTPVVIDIDQLVSQGTYYGSDGTTLSSGTQDVYYSKVDSSGEPGVAGWNPFDIVATGISGGLEPAKISVQNSTIGVGGDDVLQTSFGDIFKVTFDKDASYAQNDIRLASAKFTVTQFSAASKDSFALTIKVGSTEVVYTIDPDKNLGGLPAGVTMTEIAPGTYDVSVSLASLSGISVDQFEILVSAVASNIKVIDFDLGFDTIISPAAYDFVFEASFTDADGDTVYSSPFEVDVRTTPVALDLNRDGMIQYISDSDEVSGEGAANSPIVATGWILAPDGFLVYDYDLNGKVTSESEYVFTSWGSDPNVATDMQALAAYFDGDATGVKDGVLDANDVAWSYFGVWQDLNVDGVQDEGEFAYLADWDITSIALSYDADSTTYAAADGDVLVYGQMTVTYADGTDGLAEDVAFAVQSANATADAPSPSTTEPVYAVDELVTSYLETMAASGDTDHSGDLTAAELAYGLDDMVSQFIDTQGFSIDDHAAIQQEVYNELAHELNDLSLDDGIDIAFDDFGDASGADVLAALDHHFMDIYDAHITPAENYDDSGSMTV